MSRLSTVTSDIGLVATTVAVRRSPAREHGDLAEHVARSQCAHDLAVPNDVRGSRRDGERGKPEVAFLHERRTLLDVEFLADLGNRRPLVERHAREKRDGVELGSVHAATLSTR